MTKARTETTTYSCWEGIVQRCLNPKSHCYARYGGRGITVCDRWRNSFDAFLEDMGEQPPGLQIDRIDNNAGYCKENCRWATRAQQNRNRCNNQLITHSGETLCLTDWANRIGIHPDTLRARLRQGWEIYAAISTPSLGRGNRRSITAEFKTK